MDTVTAITGMERRMPTNMAMASAAAATMKIEEEDRSWHSLITTGMLSRIISGVTRRAFLQDWPSAVAICRLDWRGNFGKEGLCLRAWRRESGHSL